MTSTNTPLPAETVQRLVELLIRDDSFREAFSANPSQALTTLGVDEEATRACCNPIANLATKEEFEALREKLTKHLQINAAFRVVFCFEAGRAASQLDGDA
ncbi:NHLP-related RiPP peptide [Stenotrophomonas rhizophila]|uniref:NHLP-related RiPP peptide n=1 Tax=Stenotrophomonas rhizophila TaxID=216778 RepID=UPI001E4793E8|nr:NHLP-related RiPP peptide [Stenotrophomonas rhizophila]MCC7633121.1 NHLP-related RiPP peptide [Stenotrophomonas rhizophila]MCC7662014.1 NHLP-related RiPP peptide [Stenotrophomonas rhizophila]